MFFPKKIIFICNILFFFINIVYLFYNNNNKKEPILKEYKPILLNQIKKSDLLSLFFSNKNYLDISNYLNSKYGVKKSTLILNQTFMPKRRIRTRSKQKKKIVLFGVDLFSFKHYKLWLKKNLKDKFIIKFSHNKPDYLFFNIFGSEHLNPKYNNSIKIAVFTENKIPNLNEVDYAIGHSHISYLDRYFKYNTFFWIEFNNFYNSMNKTLNNTKKTKFCAALISNNCSTDGFRMKFIKELSKYKKVDMGGKIGNNIGRPITNKNEFFSSYKFSIAMENSEGDGYISEKIKDSFLAGTIPIYYGDYMIDEYINPKSFILIKGEKDIYEKIEYIKEIDNNEELYNNILKEKVIIDKNIVNDNEKELKEFLCHIFEQDKSKAYRK